MEFALCFLIGVIGGLLSFFFGYYTRTKVEKLREEFKNEQPVIPPEESKEQMEQKRISEETARQMEEGLNSILNYKNPAKGRVTNE